MWRAVYLALVLVLPLYFNNAPANRWGTVLFSVWLGLLLILYGLRVKSEGVKADFWFGWVMMAALLGLVAQALGVSVAPVLSFWEDLRWWGLLGFAYLSFRYLESGGRSAWRRLAKVMIASSFLVVLNIFVEEVWWPERWGAVTKLNGPMGWHNQLAGYWLMLMALVVYRWWRSLAASSLGLKLAWSLWMGVLGSGLVLTYSRGAWISGIAAGLVTGGVWLISGWKQGKFGEFEIERLKLGWVLLVAVAVALITYGLTGQPAGKMMSRAKTIAAELDGQGRSLSGQYRVVAWRDSARMIFDRPVWGWGLGAYRMAYREYQHEPWIVVNFPHNLFFRVGAELGIGAGLVMLVLVLAVIGLGMAGVWRRRGGWMVVLVWAFTAEVIHNLLDLDSNLTSLAGYWLLLGVMIIWRERSWRRAVRLKDKSKLTSWLWIGLGLVMVLGGVYLYKGMELPRRVARMYAAGGLKSGLKLAREGVKIYPYEYELWTAVADGADRLKMPAVAMAAARRSVEVFPNYVEGYYNLAVYEWNQGERRQAVESLKTGLERAPNISPLPYLRLAAWYHVLGQTELEKDELYECAFVRFPRNEAFSKFEWMIKYTPDLKLRDRCEAGWALL